MLRRQNRSFVRRRCIVKEEAAAMIKTILVPAQGGESDRAAFAAALAIARPFAAHIDALHVRLDPVEIAVATAAGDGTGAGGAMVQQLIDQLEQEAGERED